MEERRNAEAWAMLMVEAKKAGMSPAEVREFLFGRKSDTSPSAGAAEKECS
ncbi:MAG: DNA-binding anti-repressor SinI [Alkalicoccus sp.]|nr:MAG: DNA-binding anti-repressor SinI [Alkalicoccus sp.]